MVTLGIRRPNPQCAGCTGEKIPTCGACEQERERERAKTMPRGGRRRGHSLRVTLRHAQAML
eukprot:12240704-Alexandrium_andersonii.AAC.1